MSWSVSVSKAWSAIIERKQCMKIAFTDKNMYSFGHGVICDKICDIINSEKFVWLGVRYFDDELFFASHHNLYSVQRVQVEIFLKARGSSDLFLVNLRYDMWLKWSFAEVTHANASLEARYDVSEQESGCARTFSKFLTTSMTLSLTILGSRKVYFKGEWTTLGGLNCQLYTFVSWFHLITYVTVMTMIVSWVRGTSEWSERDGCGRFTGEKSWFYLFRSDNSKTLSNTYNWGHFDKQRMALLLSELCICMHVCSDTANRQLYSLCRVVYTLTLSVQVRYSRHVHTRYTVHGGR